jgi:hypothetical protein
MEFEVPVTALRCSCVYQFVREERVIYVGYSRLGVVRPLSSSHHKMDARKICDRIVIELYEDEGEAKAREEELIDKLNPPCNHEPKRADALDMVVLISKVGLRKAGDWVSLSWFKNYSNRKEILAPGVLELFGHQYVPVGVPGLV